jgi:nucleoside-diphosphate-sugar epimerase
MLTAVTGHTSGIGAGVWDALRERGHDLRGISRSTGFDLHHFPTIVRTVEAVADCDLLVNNAHAGMAQTRLLYAMSRIWGDNPSKTVLVIGSDSPDGIKPRPHEYAVEKAALDKAVEQLQRCYRWRLMILRPGYVDTPRVASIEATKLPVADVVRTALWMIDSPPHTLVRRVDMAPR